MNIDRLSSDRYWLAYPDGRVGRGWPDGIEWTQRDSSPPVVRGADEGAIAVRPRHLPPIDLAGIWPDTADYDQNTPGILNKAFDLNTRYFADWFDHEVWLNLLRVPFAFSYLGACAKVQPRTILELGTGGDSAHSTGMFQYWLSRSPVNAAPSPVHVSVDRHYLSHSWLRYRHSPNWHFIQGDSMHVLKALRKKAFPNFPAWWDLIFIDSSHLYQETKDEIAQSSLMTNAMLFDDTTTEGVHQALMEFQSSKAGQEWLRVDIWPTVCLLERHERS